MTAAYRDATLLAWSAGSRRTTARSTLWISAIRVQAFDARRTISTVVKISRSPSRRESPAFWCSAWPTAISPVVAQPAAAWLSLPELGRRASLAMADRQDSAFGLARRTGRQSAGQCLYRGYRQQSDSAQSGPMASSAPSPKQAPDRWRWRRGLRRRTQCAHRTPIGRRRTFRSHQRERSHPRAGPSCASPTLHRLPS